MGDLVFIDSLQFLNASLEKLVSNLAKDVDGKFRVLKKYTPVEKVPLLLRKGVYPYEYVDSFQKFQQTNLTPIEAFFSTLCGCKDHGAPWSLHPHKCLIFKNHRSFRRKSAFSIADFTMVTFCDIL